MKKFTAILAAAMLCSTAAQAEICKSETEFAEAVLDQWETAWQKAKRQYPLGEFSYYRDCKDAIRGSHAYCGNDNWISSLVDHGILQVIKKYEEPMLPGAAATSRVELQPGPTFDRWRNTLRLENDRVVWEPRYTFALDKVLKTQQAIFKGVPAMIVHFSYFAEGDPLQQLLHGLEKHRKARVLVYCDDSTAEIVNAGGEFGNYGDAGFRDAYGASISAYLVE